MPFKKKSFDKAFLSKVEGHERNQLTQSSIKF
jgi:hypothetical protein